MADNSNKIILDLCGGTGAWSKPYKDAGYTVELITLPRNDVTRVEFGDHAMHFERMDLYYYDDLTVLYKDVYGILAAPPCTEFSLAKNGAPTPRDLNAGMAIVRPIMEIIWRCQLYGNLKFLALENPVGLLRRFLGRPKYSYRHWQFGDPQVKPTDIWGYFKEPTQSVKQMPEGITKRYSSGKVNTLAWAPPKPPDWLDASNLTRADLRAITPAGFAQAFYKANQ